MTAPPELAVVVPMKNEAENALPLLAEIHSALDRSPTISNERLHGLKLLEHLSQILSPNLFELFILELTPGSHSPPRPLWLALLNNIWPRLQPPGLS